MRTGFFIGLCFLAWPLQAADDFYREQTRQRISPIGQVRVQEDKATQAQDAAEKPKEVAKKEPGQETYEIYCSTCHKTGLAGAPKFRDEAEWKPRLEKGGIEGLVQTAIKGINAMPPKGTCMQCSEADIKAAVEYMVPKS